MNVNGMRIISRRVAMLLLFGLFLMTGHPLVHAFEHLSSTETIAHHHDSADKNIPDEKQKQEECLECVLSSFLSFEEPVHSLFTSVQSSSGDKETLSFCKKEHDFCFSLRAPPSVNM